MGLLSAAFDQHENLIFQLRQMGIGGTFLNIIAIFLKEKCGDVLLVSSCSSCIQVPEDDNIKDIDETGHKYLGVLDGHLIKHQLIKEKRKKE